jgi:hypothetical protein
VPSVQRNSVIGCILAGKSLNLYPKCSYLTIISTTNPALAGKYLSQDPASNLVGIFNDGSSNGAYTWTNSTGPVDRTWILTNRCVHNILTTCFDLGLSGVDGFQNVSSVSVTLRFTLSTGSTTTTTAPISTISTISTIFTTTPVPTVSATAADPKINYTNWRLFDTGTMRYADMSGSSWVALPLSGGQYYLAWWNCT